MKYLFTSLLLLFTLLACDKEELTPSAPADESLLFKRTLALPIAQTTDGARIGFLIPELPARYLQLSVFDAAPVALDGRVSTEDLRWSYRGDYRAGDTVFLQEGQLSDPQRPLDFASLQCADAPLYWGAWAWEETAHLVTHSSRRNQVIALPDLAPQLKMIVQDRVGVSPGDTLIGPGDSVTVRLTIGNTGNQAAENITVRLRQPDIEDLPTTEQLASLLPKQDAGFSFTFSIPEDATLGAEFPFVVEMSYNDCFTETANFKLRVNALNVFLRDVRLKRINFLPPLFLWDPFAILPIFYDPDIYYLLFGPNSKEIARSKVIDNADTGTLSTPCLGDWPDLSPVLPLEIDSTYRLDFWDEDSDRDDFIGSITFRPLDYVAGQDSVIQFSTDEVNVELYLEWQ